MVALAALLTLAEIALVATFVLGALGFIALIVWDVAADNTPRRAEPEPEVAAPAYKPERVPAV